MPLGMPAGLPPEDREGLAASSWARAKAGLAAAAEPNRFIVSPRSTRGPPPAGLRHPQS